MTGPAAIAKIERIRRAARAKCDAIAAAAADRTEQIIAECDEQDRARVRAYLRTDVDDLPATGAD